MKILYRSKKKDEAVPVVLGLLYNHHVLYDSRAIASSGWHVMDDDEFYALVNLAGPSYVGGKCKETGLTYWASPNVGATNELKFNARANNYYRNEYKFILRTNAWNEDGTPAIYSYRSFSSSNSSWFISQRYYTQYYTWGERCAGAIRLVKDSTTLLHGEEGEYTGNNGRKYRTICIGTIEVLADSLCETEYRNGDTIPVAADYSSLLGATSGATYPVDGDWGNV